MRIGVDVGGTNTDAVLMEGARVLAKAKTPTSADVTSGIMAALRSVIPRPGLGSQPLQGVMIGTTLFTNAILERRGLARTAVIRLCLPATQLLPPLIDWPDDLRRAIHGQGYLLHGGHEFDGRPISPLDETELKKTARELRQNGVQAVALCDVFSPVDASFEERAAAILQSELPGLSITLSHEIGRVGLLERENAAALNACLSTTAGQAIAGIEKAIGDMGLKAPVFWTQNDGTLMASEFAARYPVLTLASGPTNSMRGAAFLSEIKDGVVVDIGGTSTDVGMLVRGFPREAAASITIGGVRTNFRMPDVYSMALGGGSLVSDNPLAIGPLSVGYRLTEQALVFGGDVLTATDVAVAAGLVSLGDTGRLHRLDSSLVARSVQEIQRRVAEAVDMVKLAPHPVPVVLVGGGSILVRNGIEGASEVIRPEHFEVANAIGAAIAQVGGQVDRVYALGKLSRQEALDAAREEAVQRAVQAGALAETVEIVEIEDIPLAYLPSNVLRVRVKAVGDLPL